MDRRWKYIREFSAKFIGEIFIDKKFHKINDFFSLSAA